MISIILMMNSLFQTRLLVTHDIKWLPSSDQVLVVSQGHISERGSFDELVDRQGEFSKFIQARLQQADQSTISADVNSKWLCCFILTPSYFFIRLHTMRCELEL